MAHPRERAQTGVELHKRAIILADDIGRSRIPFPQRIPAPVPHAEWIAYRMWCDDQLAGAAPGSFHEFIIAHTLAISTPSRRAAWTGSDAADLIACLAAAGLLIERVPKRSALTRYLEASLAAYNKRFTFAQHREYEGYTEEEEKKTI